MEIIIKFESMNEAISRKELNMKKQLHCSDLQEFPPTGLKLF